MKRGTTPVLRIQHEGLNLADVASITYLFKAQKSQCAKTLLEKTVTAFNADSDIVEVPFTMEETYSLPDSTVYMDTRILLQNGSIPETPIVAIRVDETLFDEAGDTT